MTRPLAPTPAKPRRHAALLASLLALACVLPLNTAYAQFSGDAGNDLTSTGSGTGDDTDGSTGDTGTGTGSASGNSSQAGGTTQLRQPANGTITRGNQQPEPADPYYRRQRYQPSEFERYVQRRADDLARQGQTQDVDPDDQDNLQAQQTSLQSNNANGQNDKLNVAPIVQTVRKNQIRRFGANLMADPIVTGSAQDPLPLVPGDYIIRAGDEVQLTIWGSVSADLRLVVDRSGNIAVPRIGAVRVAGLHNADLAETLNQRVGQTYKNFQLTAAIGRVHAIRVFVGGYAQRPGSLVVSGLSSVLHVLMRAGGPSAAGSFRDIHLRRGGKEVATFDLYDLLLKGDRDTDQLVQPDDIVFIGPIGTQIAVLGSVNQQAIFELQPGETLVDALRMAGGFNAVADRSRVAIERLADRNSGHVAELKLPAHAHDALDTGDLVHVFSAISASVAQEVQNEHVRVEGEVAHPGDYILPPGSHISDVLRLAGGMTSGAYPYGTEFTRETVRKQQEANYERALRDLETDMAKNQANQRVTSSEELAAQNNTASANARLLQRLRQVRPTGRVVLQMQPDAKALPDLALEDGDTIKVPNQPSSIGIFGSVFNTGSFIYEPGHTTQQYLAQAGGPTRGADKGSIFMIRANGSVISASQGSSFWNSGGDFDDAVVQAGDTLFVPEQVSKATFVQDAKDWTQILYQFGLGLAGVKSLGL